MRGLDGAGERSWLRVVPVGVFLIALTGCGNRTYPVRGVVVYEDDRPATDLAGCGVSFNCAELKVSAQGRIKSDATFTLNTNQKDDGAYAGTYLVVVTPPPPSGSESGPAQAPVLDPRYSDLKTSDLKVTVEPKKNEVTLKLKRPKR